MNDQIEIVKAACLAIAVIALIFLMAWIADAPDRELLNKVQSGEMQLRCLFKDGWRDVDPDKVTDLYGTVWIFENGSASRLMMLLLA